MCHGIEARFPFLDEEIIRFGINLPLRWKVRRVNHLHDQRHPFLEDKWIVRQAGFRCLPAPLASRPKHGFRVDAPTRIKFEPDFFRGGYVAECLRLRPVDCEYMVRSQRAEDVSQLASVEVFGQLFAFHESIDEVRERLERHARVLVDA